MSLYGRSIQIDELGVTIVISKRTTKLEEESHEKPLPFVHLRPVHPDPWPQPCRRLRRTAGRDRHAGAAERPHRSQAR